MGRPGRHATWERPVRQQVKGFRGVPRDKLRSEGTRSKGSVNHALHTRRSQTSLVGSRRFSAFQAPLGAQAALASRLHLPRRPGATGSAGVPPASAAPSRRVPPASSRIRRESSHAVNPVGPGSAGVPAGIFSAVEARSSISEPESPLYLESAFRGPKSPSRNPQSHGRPLSIGVNWGPG